MLTGSIGVVALAASLEAYFLRASWFERVLFFAAALLLIDPGFVTDVIGIGLLAVALLMQKLWTPQSPGAGSEHVTRTQIIALTLIASALVVGTVVYGVLRLYAS